MTPDEQHTIETAPMVGALADLAERLGNLLAQVEDHTED
jgi:hypothetical protein